MHTQAPSHRKELTKQFVQDCLETYRVCRETASYLLTQPERSGNLRLLRMLHDVADVHYTMVQLLTRGSVNDTRLAPVCAELARDCAETLAAWEHEDGQLRAAFATCSRAQRCCLDWVSGICEGEMDERDIALKGTFPASDAPPPPSTL